MVLNYCIGYRQKTKCEYHIKDQIAVRNNFKMKQLGNFLFNFNLFDRYQRNLSSSQKKPDDKSSNFWTQYPVVKKTHKMAIF